MGLTKKEVQHIFWRLGFGPSPKEVRQFEGSSTDKVLTYLFDRSSKIEPLNIDLTAVIREAKKKRTTRDQKQAFRKLQNKKMFEMNLIWLEKMSTTNAVLREKMVFFFHDHFAVRIKSPLANIHLHEIMRKHALGNFGDMLMEVSKSPAMIAFLNNKQNKKDHPNENFAREVMELFTLGRDNGYTEDDIKEAARAFTGWSFDKTGTFVFRQHNHDGGSKTILGKTGNFDGEDVIRILLEEEQTARYLTEKLVDYIVGRKLSSEVIGSISRKFFESNYDMSTLLKAICSHSEFLDPSSIGCKIKSPTELLVGMNRLFDVNYKNEKALVQIQRKLNQVLFSPPNVAGWLGGKSWIDSSTLMLRLKIPSTILNFGVIEWDEKGDMPEQVLLRIDRQRDKTKERTEKRVKAYPNWDKFEQEIDQESDRLVDFLIQPSLAVGAKQTLENSDSVSLMDRTIEIMSLPEYQLF